MDDDVTALLGCACFNVRSAARAVTIWGDDVVGINLNELTDAADRDPFTGCPHHKYVACRVSRAQLV